MLYSLTGCTQANNLPPGCSGKDVLLDSSFFAKPGVTDSGVQSPLPEGTKDSAGITLYLSRGFLIQQIYPYSSYSRAESEYNENLRDPVFGEQGIDKAWSIPEEIEFLEIKADNIRVACGEQNNIPMCRAIFHHGNYYVKVNGHMYEEDISVTDFIQLINELDARIKNCVE